MDNIVRAVDWKRIRNTEVLFNNPCNVCNGVNYGSCIRASYGCFQLHASHGATDESDSDFVTSILEHPVALPKVIRMHVAF